MEMLKVPRAGTSQEKSAATVTYTQKTITDLLPGVTMAGLRTAMEQGLPGKKIGRNYYFDGEAVRTWLCGQAAERQHQACKRAVRAAKDDPRQYRDEIGES